MNKYIEMGVLEKLIKAEALLKRISASGDWAKIFSVEEFVLLDLAVLDAKKLLSDDLLARVEN